MTFATGLGIMPMLGRRELWGGEEVCQASAVVGSMMVLMGVMVLAGKPDSVAWRRINSSLGAM